MKTVTLIVMLFGLCAGWGNYAMGATWVEYAAVGGNTFLYDKESVVVTGSADNIIRVWTKSVPKGDEERQKEAARLAEQLKQRGLRNKNFSTYAYTVTLNEIACNSQEYRDAFAAYYDAQGAVLFSFSSPKRAWELIVPDGPMEVVGKSLCPKPKRWWTFWR